MIIIGKEQVQEYIIAFIVSLIIVYVLWSHFMNPTYLRYEQGNTIIEQILKEQINENTTVSEKLELIEDSCNAFSNDIEHCIRDFKQEVFIIEKE